MLNLSDLLKISTSSQKDTMFVLHVPIAKEKKSKGDYMFLSERYGTSDKYI